MKWSIYQLKKQAYRLVPFDEQVELPTLLERNKDIAALQSCHVKGTIDTSASKITVSMKIDAHLLLHSSRTYEEVPFHVELDVQETFLLEDGQDASEEYEVLEGETLNLIPLVEELVLLEIPLQVYAPGDEDAPRGGQGWTIIEEVEETEKVDPRLAKLAQFFNDKQK
ncbi:MAG: YceD family protein [Bacilli bacterium]